MFATHGHLAGVLLCKARSSHPVTVTLRAREASTLQRIIRPPPPPPAHGVLFTRVGERRKSGIRANDKLARSGRAKRREAHWPIGYGVGLRIKRSSVRIRPWPLR